MQSGIKAVYHFYPHLYLSLRCFSCLRKISDLCRVKENKHQKCVAVSCSVDVAVKPLTAGDFP